MSRNFTRLFTAVLALALVAGMLSNGTVSRAQAKVKVGLSFSDFSTERWPNENKLMTKLLQDKGYEVLSQQANQDPKVQNDQIENMVTQGAKAIIVIAQDGDAAATAVDDAAKAGVKVIAYDRLIKSTNIAAYLSFNNVAVGNGQAKGILTALGIKSATDTGKWTKDKPARVIKLGGSKTDNNAILFRQGQDEVLQPYVDAGVIKIVGDDWVKDWQAANATTLMENILTKINNGVDAVVASNDGTALGALQALQAQKLAVPISGQDATAAGCNSIVKGGLTVTIFKDIRQLSPLAVDLADQLIQGKGDAVSKLKSYTLAELTNDKTKKGNVQAYFLPVVQVTKDNVFDVVVKSGFQSYDDVYQDVPAAQRPPKPAAGAAATAAATAAK